MGERIPAVGDQSVMFCFGSCRSRKTYQVPTRGVTGGRDLVLRSQDHKDFWSHVADYFDKCRQLIKQ
jgi:hypothetical protein